jgi:phage recombination protein Bet
MYMTQAIEKRNLALDTWGAERLEVLRQSVAPGASDAELDLFAEVCSNTKLSPFAKQIWMIPRRRKVNDRWETYQVIQIGVHGLRLIAQRSREYAGQDGPYWCGPDGEWIDVWLAEEHPVAARVGVLRKGFPKPVWSVAVWKRAVQTTSEGKPMALWATRGPEQLALAAERDALRRAFPLETAGIEAVLDEESERAAAQRYQEIFMKEDDVVISGDRFVDRTTGEVHEEQDVDRMEYERQQRMEGVK